MAPSLLVRCGRPRASLERDLYGHTALARVEQAADESRRAPHHQALADSLPDVPSTAQPALSQRVCEGRRMVSVSAAIVTAVHAEVRQEIAGFDIVTDITNGHGANDSQRVLVDRLEKQA